MNVSLRESLLIPRFIRRIDWVRSDTILTLSFFMMTALVAVSGYHPKKFGDLYFHREAIKIASVIHGAASADEIAISHAPGPSFFYALPYTLLAEDASEETRWRAAVLFNCAGSLLGLLLLRRAGTMLFDEVSGLLAGMLLVLAPLNSYYSFGIIAEPPAALGFIIFLFGWAREKAHGQPGWRPNLNAWLMALGLLLFVLCRPNGLVGCALWAMCLAWLWLRGATRAPQDLRRSTAALLLFGLLFATSWTMLPKGGDSQEGHLSHVFFFGSFQTRTEPWNWRYWTSRKQTGDKQLCETTLESLRAVAAEQNRSLAEVKQEWVVRDVMENPLLRLRMFLVRLLVCHVQFLGSVSPDDFQLGPLRARWGFALFHALFNSITLLAVLGAVLWLISKPGERLAHSALWAPYLGVLVFAAFSYAEPRFMFPVRAGLCVLAGAYFGGRFPGLVRFMTSQRPSPRS